MAKNFIAFLLMALCISSMSFAQTQEITKSPYKLFFLNTTGKAFNPEQDILNPTAEEELVDAIRTQVISAALKSVMPFVSSSFSISSLDLNAQIMLMVSNLRTDMLKGLKKAVTDDGVLPLTHSFMLIPNMSQTDNTFYDNDKISMSSDELVNVLTLTPSHPKFSEKLTETIKKSRNDHFLVVPGSKLLAAKSDITVTSTNNAQITIQILLALNPNTAPFSEKNEKVEFQKVVIPDNKEYPPSAILTFTIDLSNQAKAPTLLVELGHFDRYDYGSFLIDPKVSKKSQPRLEGKVAKKGLGFVAVQIGFERLKFDLSTLNLTEINTITKPGLKIGKSAFVIGGFNIASVDKEFETEINNTIDSEISKAIQKGSDYVDSQLMNKNVMESLLKQIMK
jgi:hypothetical protein